MIHWQSYYQQNKHLPLNKIMEGYNLLLNEFNVRLSYITQQNSAFGCGPAAANEAAQTPASSGTIVFNGQNPNVNGSFVAAPNSNIKNWLPGTGSFTIEWFQKFNQTGGGSFPRVWSIGPDTSPTLGVSLEGSLYIWPIRVSGAWSTDPNNRWAHVAIVYDSTDSGGRISLFMDGTRKATQTGLNLNIADTTDHYDLYIGSDGLSANDGFAGNITNFRWTNSVVYTPTATTLTVPSAPLAALPQTKLLLLGGSESNPVVDSTGTNTLNYRNIAWSAETPF